MGLFMKVIDEGRRGRRKEVFGPAGFVRSALVSLALVTACVGGVERTPEQTGEVRSAEESLPPCHAIATPGLESNHYEEPKKEDERPAECKDPRCECALNGDVPNLNKCIPDKCVSDPTEVS